MRGDKGGTESGSDDYTGKLCSGNSNIRKRVMRKAQDERRASSPQGLPAVATQLNRVDFPRMFIGSRHLGLF